MLFDDIYDKPNTIYWPVLNAFSDELTRIQNSKSIKEELLCKNLISYLIGNNDFYKIIATTNEVVIQGFNFHNSLAIPKSKYPKQIVGIDKKNGGIYSKNLRFSGGYTINFRIHNASSRVEPSLKFAISAISFPPKEIYTQNITLWKWLQLTLVLYKFIVRLSCWKSSNWSPTQCLARKLVEPAWMDTAHTWGDSAGHDAFALPWPHRRQSRPWEGIKWAHPYQALQRPPRMAGRRAQSAGHGRGTGLRLGGLQPWDAWRDDFAAPAGVECWAQWGARVRLPRRFVAKGCPAGGVVKLSRSHFGQ